MLLGFERILENSSLVDLLKILEYSGGIWLSAFTLLL